jgi:hypothetical protein
MEQDESLANLAGVQGFPVHWGNLNAHGLLTRKTLRAKPFSALLLGIRDHLRGHLETKLH